MRGGRPAPETARAIEVITDLSLRGYPPSRAAGLVQDVLARDAAAVGRLPAALEVLRREQALSHGETVDALARGLQRGRLARAGLRAAPPTSAARAGAPANRGGGDGEPGRKEGFVPPGQLKKQLGTKGRRPRAPGAAAAPGKPRQRDPIIRRRGSRGRATSTFWADQIEHEHETCSYTISACDVPTPVHQRRLVSFSGGSR